MPKKNIESKKTKKIDIIKQEVTDTLTENYMPYAMSVIVSRALPEIDGFKPSHRKLLYSMYKMGLLTSKETKCANIVGQTMRLNPHGDQAIYDTMVRLTDSNEALIFPFVKGKGSFGKHFSRDMAPAHYRYTEAKLHNNSELIFRDIDKNCVDFIDNYDSTMKEPSLLPVLFPNILTNGNLGIAVGMASNICSFNLNEICNTTIALLKSSKAIISNTLLGPDFPTGGELLMDKVAMESIYACGKGSFKVRSYYSYDKKNNRIEIREIPYSTTVEAIIDKVIELSKDNRVSGISDIRDETDKNGLKIAIELKKDIDAEKLMQKLFKLTSLCDSFGCNFNIIINGNPKVLGVKDILLAWIDFRIDCVRKALTYDLSKKENKLHILEGISKVILDIDTAIKLIRKSEDNMVVINLMKKFKIDEEQANFIADIKLRNINKEYLMKMLDNVSLLESEIIKLKDILSDDKKIKKIIIRELEDINKKYPCPRKTKIIENFVDNYVEEEIPPQESFVVISTNHYLQKLVSEDKLSDIKLKDGDIIYCSNKLNDNDEVLLFTDAYEVYKSKISEFSFSKLGMLGEYLPAFMSIPPNQSPIFSCILDKYKYLLFCYDNGKVAKIPMTSYLTLTNRKKLSNAYYSKVKLIKILVVDNESNIKVTLTNDKEKIVSVSKISEKSSKNSQGVDLIHTKNNLFKNVESVK